MKKVLYVILALVVVYLVLCIAGPSSVTVQRSVSMNASVDAVKSQVSDYNLFAKWSPWQEKDPTMKSTVEGEAGKPGHKYSWEGNKDVGKGTMEISSISADTLAEKLNFDGKGISDVYFIFKAEGAATNVTWSMTMKVPFFGRGMMMFFKGKMDKMLGGDFEKGLEKLKGVAETASTASTSAANYEIKEMDWTEERTYFGTKTNNLTMEKISPFFAENFPKIWGDLEKAKVTPASAPTCLCFKWDDATKSGDFAAVLAADKKAPVKGWEKYTVPAGKVLKVEYFGAYDKVGAAHEAMGKYMKEKGLTQGLVLEEYVTDPMSEKDTAKWQTNIYYTIK
jgi:hypothetical protein